MALVDVVLANPDSESGEHPGPADPEHHRLFEAVLLVSAIEVVGYLPIRAFVLRQVRIEEEHRHEAADRAPVVVEPGPDRDVCTPYPYRHPLREFSHMRTWIPLVGEIDLVALGRQALPHVAFPVDERHRNHRYEKVGARSDDIPGEHSEAAAIGRYVALKTDLHREVGDLLSIDERISAEFS